MLVLQTSLHIISISNAKNVNAINIFVFMVSMVKDTIIKKKPLIMFFLPLFLMQSCIIVHKYKDMTNFNAQINTGLIQTSGYYIANYDYQFKLNDLEDTNYYKKISSDYKKIDDSVILKKFHAICLFNNGTYFNHGIYYNNSDNQNNLNLPQNDTLYSKELAKQSYAWGCYSIKGDTLSIQTFRHHWPWQFPIPAILVWTVQEERLKILNDSTLQEIDILYRNKLTKSEGRIYQFKRCFNCKPHPRNYISDHLNNMKKLKFRLPLIFYYSK